MAIEFPARLNDLLKDDGKLQSAIRALANRAGEIVTDNKLPFFPDYTDHGVNHINDVLKSEVELIPDEVWNLHLLGAADATVIIGATLLHDLAMHLTIKGFRELIADDTRFKPLDWFKESQEGHSADRPWPELWRDYEREARRFSDRALIDIIGEESVHGGWKFDKLPDVEGSWKRNHYLIVGEFTRRHHARLAHEIAIYGFPGLNAGSREDEFPAIGARGHELQDLADLIGVTARSHWLSLRVCQKYLEESPLYPDETTQMDASTLYAMALLRVADYLQIDKKRAPAVLLQLKNPPSPISVREWTKHHAVRNVKLIKDKRVASITITRPATLQLYLSLEELLNGLQAEMDHSTAVLDDVYGSRTTLNLHHLNLAIRRVKSNFHDPAFLKTLPYVPKRTGFSTDPNLLTLLVEPLYGEHPGVGVRELMQNAVDAVRELKTWCDSHNKTLDSLDLPKQDCDVLIDFIKRDNGTWFLRVTDKGIGMTADTIQNYFLRAGASFRQSAEWAKEYLDDDGKPRVLRAGHFGIGAFATFLLGPSFRLWTRHASADKAMGFTFGASADSDLIEIQRQPALPVGSMIELELSEESVEALFLESSYSNSSRYHDSTDWYCWDWPVVYRRIGTQTKTTRLINKFSTSINEAETVSDWLAVDVNGFKKVFWTFTDAPNIVCNGIKIAKPSATYYGGAMRDARVGWPDETQLECPKIAVLDNKANLSLTIQRYSLTNPRLPFVSELARDVTLSFIAHALTCGPTSHISMNSNGPHHRQHPLIGKKYSDYQYLVREFPFLVWCSTRHEIIPCDQWLYSILNSATCFVYGILDSHWRTELSQFDHPPLSEITKAAHATLCWDGSFSALVEENQLSMEIQAKDFLNRLCHLGVQYLGHQIISSCVIASLNYDLRFHNSNEVTPSHSLRKWYRLQSGDGPFTLPLENWLTEMQDNNKESIDCLYVAELHTKPANPQPESLIAKIWNECLGPTAIPFDPEARKALIEKGRQHTELRHHIEKWEEMKRTGSKWVQ